MQGLEASSWFQVITNLAFYIAGVPDSYREIKDDSRENISPEILLINNL